MEVHHLLSSPLDGSQQILVLAFLQVLLESLLLALLRILLELLPLALPLLVLLEFLP